MTDSCWSFRINWEWSSIPALLVFAKITLSHVLVLVPEAHVWEWCNQMLSSWLFTACSKPEEPADYITEGHRSSVCTGRGQSAPPPPSSCQREHSLMANHAAAISAVWKTAALFLSVSYCLILTLTVSIFPLCLSGSHWSNSSGLITPEQGQRPLPNIHTHRLCGLQSWSYRSIKLIALKAPPLPL